MKTVEMTKTKTKNKKGAAMKKVKKRPKPKDLAGEKVISSHKLQPIGIT